MMLLKLDTGKSRHQTDINRYTQFLRMPRICAYFTYLDLISALTRSVRGFEAATAVSTAFPMSSSPSSIMNKIEPIAVYMTSKIMTPIKNKEIKVRQ